MRLVPALSELHQTLASGRHTHSKHVTNHAEHPRRFGVMTGARDQTRAKPAATRSAPLNMTSVGTAASESGERTAGRVRCRSCSALSEKRAARRFHKRQLNDSPSPVGDFADRVGKYYLQHLLYNHVLWPITVLLCCKCPKTMPVRWRKANYRRKIRENRFAKKAFLAEKIHFFFQQRRNISLSGTAETHILQAIALADFLS